MCSVYAHQVDEALMSLRRRRESLSALCSIFHTYPAITITSQLAHRIASEVVCCPKCLGSSLECCACLVHLLHWQAISPLRFFRCGSVISCSSGFPSALRCWVK